MSVAGIMVGVGVVSAIWALPNSKERWAEKRENCAEENPLVDNWPTSILSSIIDRKDINSKENKLNNLPELSYHLIHKIESDCRENFMIPVVYRFFTLGFIYLIVIFDLGCTKTCWRLFFHQQLNKIVFILNFWG